MMTSSRDKEFIQISSDRPSIDVHPTRTLNTGPLPQINRLVWHYSSGTYRSVDVCAPSKSNVRAQFRPSSWPWFAHINWKNYHSIISICSTSLCKGAEGRRAGIRMRTDRGQRCECIKPGAGMGSFWASSRVSGPVWKPTSGRNTSHDAEKLFYAAAPVTMRTMSLREAHFWAVMAQMKPKKQFLKVYKGNNSY